MNEAIKVGLQWILILCVCCGLWSCEKVENFTDVDGPRFSGDFAPSLSGITPEEIKIVTFNIEFAIKIDEAIRELGENENLRNADMVFLQEMDEVGSEAIASALDYNYIYYPSSRNLDDQLYGLTILSKWPILDDEKIILPHATPVNDRRRIAVTADIMVGTQLVRIYNVHFSTFIVPKSKRREQFRVIVNHLNDLEENQTVDHTIIAGDFNTDKSNDIDYLVDIYGAKGFVRTSEDVGPTWQTLNGLTKYTLDHVFTRGFDLINAGKPSVSDASDHLPIWMQLKL